MQNKEESTVQNIKLNSTSGRDGKLHLEVPVGQADTEFEVELMVRPKMTVRTYPPGYFDLIGSVDDDTLIIHPQPPIPPPLEIE
jgi:hypothetical protein